ncbi:hypothetical protein D9M71_257770 [compost metagenome]
MAAGEHHAGFALEDVGRVVKHRGRHHADVGDLAAAIQQALDQLLHQFRTGQAAVAAHGYVGLAPGQAFRADGAADPVGGLGGQGIANHAADVVGAEDAGGQLRGFRAHSGVSLQSQEILVFIKKVDVQNVGVLEQRIDQLRSGRGRSADGSRGRSGGSGGSGAGCFVLAAGLANQRLNHALQGCQAQFRSFGSPRAAEFLNVLRQFLGILAQAALQPAVRQVNPEQAAGQRQQRGDAEQRRRVERRGQGGAGGEAEFPVRIAAGQGQRLAVVGLAGFQQRLRRVVAELLGEQQLADFLRHGRQGAEEALQVEHQQQGAMHAVVRAAQGGGAVEQPALAEPVGLGADFLAVLQAVQHVQRGIVQRAGPLVVLAGLAVGVQVDVQQAAQRPLRLGLLQAADARRVVGLHGLQQFGIAGHAAGVGGQVGQCLAQRAGLAFGPGAGELLAVHLLGAAEQAEPQQRAGRADAEQRHGHAGQQGAGGARGRSGMAIAIAVVRHRDRWQVVILGSALEKSHATSPRRFILKSASVAARMPETTGAALAFVEAVDQLEMRLHHRHQNQLGDALADGDGERGLAAVPAGHHQLALVVRVDQPDQVAQHHAVLVAQAGARQDQRGQVRVGDMDGQAGGDQQGLARLEDGVLLEHGAQVEAGGAGRGVLRQGEFRADARIEDLGLQ